MKFLLSLIVLLATLTAGCPQDACTEDEIETCSEQWTECLGQCNDVDTCIATCNDEYCFCLEDAHCKSNCAWKQACL